MSVDLNKGATVELVKTLSDDLRTKNDGTKATSAGSAVRTIQTDVTDLKSKFDDIYEVIPSQNIFEGYTQSGRLDNTTGAETAAVQYKRTDFIPVDASKETLYVLRDANFMNSLRVFFYDQNKAFISPNVLVFNTGVTALRNTVTIPSTAHYFRTYTAADANGIVSFAYSYQETIVSHDPTERIKNNLVDYDSLKPSLIEWIKSLYGKKIVFMGDSVIGNFNDSTGVCAQIADRTGAEVINCAFGGSRMGYEYSAYGDATPTASGYNPGATDAQKNQVDIYRNWNTLSGVGLADAIASGVWTSQDTAVASATDMPTYFADRLATIKAVDWTTVDYLMWEYGTNDFMTRVALQGSDLFAYDYAYRHVIETILTAYPNVRIVTVTPMYRWYQSDGVFTDDSNTHTENDYQGTSHKLTDFVAMAQTVSKEYQLPCIDDYYTLGANKFTRLQFFNASDGTHPNANGRSRIAEHIASQLDSVR